MCTYLKHINHVLTFQISVEYITCYLLLKYKFMYIFILFNYSGMTSVVFTDVKIAILIYNTPQVIPIKLYMLHI